MLTKGYSSIGVVSSTSRSDNQNEGLASASDKEGTLMTDNTTDAERTAQTRTKHEGTEGGSTTRRDVLKAGAVGTATAALAGCLSFLEGDSGGDTTNIDQDELEAGLLTFTEGAAAVLGQQAQRGAEKAVEWINNAGGIAGQAQLSLETVDEGSNPVDQYNQFIDDGKDVTFGPISSGTHESMFQEIEANQVVNVGTDGTVTGLYEGEDPQYSFRFQNYDVMEVLASTREAIQRVGGNNIDTVAGVNPGYSFGQDEMEVFEAAVSNLTGAETVYSGFPDLGAGDYASHISSINSEEPDVVFSSLWGGDASTFLDQAFQRDMFDNVGAVVGPVFYGSADAISQDVVEGVGSGKILAGSRNYYWGVPQPGTSPDSDQLFEEATEQEGIKVPTAHYMSGFGAVAAWATAVESAIGVLDEFPSQKQIAATLEGHGFYTPAGYHVMNVDHQCRSNGYAGVMEWNSDLDAPVLTDVNTFAATEISPSPTGATLSQNEQTGLEWVNSL